MAILVTFKYEEDPIKIEGARVATTQNKRTNGPVNAHLSLLHITINMFEYYGI